MDLYIVDEYHEGKITLSQADGVTEYNISPKDEREFELIGRKKHYRSHR